MEMNEKENCASTAPPSPNSANPVDLCDLKNN